MLIFTVFTLALFLFFHFNFRINPKKFSTAELKNLELIKSAKQFAATIDLKETNNFVIFSEKDERLTDTCSIPNLVLPFSYIDPDYWENCKGKVKKKGQDRILTTVTYLAIAGGSIINRDFLRRPETEIVETVLHEDFHDSTNLPRNIDEAAAKIVGIAGAVLYRSGTPNDVSRTLSNILKDEVVPSLNCFDELKVLYHKMSAGKMEIGDFESRRSKILYKYGHKEKEDLIRLVFDRTYFYYFPLLALLLRAFDFNIATFIEFFKNFAYEAPPGFGEKYFNDTRRIERLAESDIRKKIISLKRSR